MDNLIIPLDEPWLSFKNNAPSLTTRILRLFLTPMDFLDPATARKRLNRIARLAKIKPPRNTRVEEIQFGNVSAIRVTPENPRKDKVVLCLHGGGYIAGAGAYCRLTAINIAKHTGWQTLAVDYRLAPEYPYPAALDDAFAAYTELLIKG